MPKNSCCDMPRGKQFGFLFTEKADPATLAKTIAHELGHGYFQLKHPFEMGLNKEQLPDNLMDYAGGTTFNKYQWDIMHDPGIVTGLFESDTSGQLVIYTFLEDNPGDSKTAKMIMFGFQHPSIAIAIGNVQQGVGCTNISTNATRFSGRIKLEENDVGEGSEVNAFRHVLWQAQIAGEYGFDIAKEVGDLHEDNPFTSLQERSFSTINEADQTIDLLNNIIGRQIAENTKGKNMQFRALTILEYFKETGLWVAVSTTSEKGRTYTIAQVKLNQSKYDTAKKILEGLDSDGFNADEQAAIKAKMEKDMIEMKTRPKF